MRELNLHALIHFLLINIDKMNVKLQSNRVLEQTPQNTAQRTNRVEHHLVNIDAAPVLIRSALKQRCSISDVYCLFFHVSISLDKKMLVTSP